MGRFVVACLSLGACFAPSAPAGLPCGNDDECPGGQTCDLVTRLCDGESVDPAVIVWTDDSAPDFEAGLYRDEVSIEPGGFAGPIGSFTGALRTRGYLGRLVGDPATTTFEDIVANAAAGAGFARSWRIDYGSNAPFGVGLAEIDDVTVVVEGEIELDVAGDWVFELLTDDAGFIDMAPPGGPFTRIVEDVFAAGPGERSLPIPIATPGWYRFRGAFQDNGGNMRLDFRIDSPVLGGGAQAVAVDQMRLRADDLTGVAIDGFDDPFDIIYFGTAHVDALDQVYGENPFAIPVGNVAYTMRSSGQVLIDIEGDYQFTIDSVQGHRMWIDNQKIADAMSAQAETTTTAPIHLVPGWHDLVVDVQKNGGGDLPSPSLTLTFAAGPTTGTIPPDHLRPVVARSQRFASGQSSLDEPIPDGGNRLKSFFVTLPGGFETEDIQYGIEIEHEDLPAIDIVLNPPQGPNVVVAATGSIPDVGTEYLSGAMPVSNEGGLWIFNVSDDAGDGLVGDILKAGVTYFGSGGVAPFATSYRFESAVRDLGDVAELRELVWRLRQGAPSLAAMQLRTCDEPAACADEPWTDVALGSVPAVTPRRFAQYGATVTTDGDVPTALDLVELRYVTR